MADDNYRIEMSWHGDSKHQYLRIGDHPSDIATLTKRQVLWSVHCDLPGFYAHRQYANLEQQKADTELCIRRLLDQFGTVYLPMPTPEAVRCHEILDQAQIPRLGEGDLTLQLSDRIRLLASRVPRAKEDNT